MSENALSEAQIRTIVALAARAPSGDNTQPWTFEWNGQCLTVAFEPARARHVLDAGFSASTIALGCLMESIQIAASSYGTRADFDFYPLTDRRQPAARVHFRSGAARKDPLFDALPQRTTDRRPFTGGDLPAQALAAVYENKPDKHLIELHLQAAISPELHNYLVAAESLVTSHPSIFLETLPWIRLSTGEIVRTRDGMPWRGTGVSAMEYPALRLMRAFPSTFRLLSRTGMKTIHAANIKRLIDSAAGLFCISASEASPSSLLQAGSLSMRLWLRLTQLGYGVQPLTLSSLMVYNFTIGMLDPDSQRLFSRYGQAAALLRNEFGIPASHIPVWMFRTGISTPLPSSWIAPRLDLETIFRVVPK